MDSHYDVVIIGAGMSGLAAGIRLAYFGHHVCIVEKHDVYGGLNSFYTLDGRRFDVGLHALTNFVPTGIRQTPLPKLLRQLRIDRDVLDLCEQSYSESACPSVRLRFANGLELLTQEIREKFPDQIDHFESLVEEVRQYDDLRDDHPYRSTRTLLTEYIKDPLLIELLLCPVMYYGSAEEHDMDFTSFVTLFKSIYCEGFCRPRQGVRRVVAELVKKYRGAGGTFLMKCGVQKLVHDRRRIREVVLEDGRVLTADIVMSSAGYPETMLLCSSSTAGNSPPEGPASGRLTFVESICVLDRMPCELGHDATIVFFNNSDTFQYAAPDSLVDVRSGVVCCPSNYDRHDDMKEGLIRLTSLASWDHWCSLPENAYRRAKQECYDRIAEEVVKFVPDFRPHVVYRDTFTPRTIHHYTGHLHGAVYGAPRKLRTGVTHLENLFICGTDQGFLGIVGSMLSGISMANRHVLSVR